MNKLLICKKTRKIAAGTLKISLEKLIAKNKPFSEVDLKDKWLEELRKYKEILPNGWYIPPPNGIAILFGSNADFSRINFSSIRPNQYWARKDVFLDLTNGIIMAYASPVDKKTGIIGDFEITLYFGKNPQIVNHLKTNLEIIKQLFDFTQIGMSLSEIAKKGIDLIQKKGLSNNILSINDPTSTNIGHTIPFSYEKTDKNEKGILNNADKDWEQAYTMISKKRRFVNSAEELKIRPGFAFTIEPRIKNSKDSKIPLASYHAIALFDKNGKKELLTNFDDLFELAGMDYLITPTP